MKTAKSRHVGEQLSEQLAHLLERVSVDEGFGNWFNIPEIRSAYEIITKKYIDNIDNVQMPKCKGRGIVIPGGGIKYFPSMWVGINRIRQVGCKLPIEVWFLGEAEIDAAMKRMLKPFDVTFKNAFEVRDNHPMRILNGWELKPFAISYSDFQEVLFIDADCAPVKNPEFLFDTEPYSRTGCIFWPDYPHWILRENVYDIFGAKKPKSTTVPGDDYKLFGLPIDNNVGWDVPVESGQMVINKAKCWKPLQLAKFWCSHSDYYFRFIHGDKEAFHLAWRRLNYRYGMPQYWPHWDLHTALQYDFKGEIIFAHRNNDKWKLNGNAIGTGRIPYERDCFELIKKLAETWNGNIWENVKPTDDECATMKALYDRTFFYHRIGHDARLIELLPKNKIGKGQAEYESTWSIFHIDGKIRLTISGKNSPTCFLYPTKGGRWKGHWLVNERMPIELIPVESE